MYKSAISNYIIDSEGLIDICGGGEYVLSSPTTVVTSSESYNKIPKQFSNI